MDIICINLPDEIVEVNEISDRYWEENKKEEREREMWGKIEWEEVEAVKAHQMCVFTCTKQDDTGEEHNETF